MTKHIADSELLDQAVAAIEKEMCVQCDGISCCRPKSLTTLGRLRALLAKPAADCGLEVVAWRVSAPLEPELGHWFDESEHHDLLSEPLIRKSDADARDAMRLERIAELEADRDRLKQMSDNYCALAMDTYALLVVRVMTVANSILHSYRERTGTAI